MKELTALSDFANSLDLNRRERACAIHVSRLLLSGLKQTTREVEMELGVTPDRANAVTEAGVAITLQAMVLAREVVT